MIKANEAYHNMIVAKTRKPIKSHTTISQMIRVASSLGYEDISFFVVERNLEGIKTKLRDLGYLVDLTYTQALPKEVLITIKWNTSEFIGETIKEIE